MSRWHNSKRMWPSIRESISFIMSVGKPIKALSRSTEPRMGELCRGNRGPQIGAPSDWQRCDALAAPRKNQSCHICNLLERDEFLPIASAVGDDERHKGWCFERWDLGRPIASMFRPVLCGRHHEPCTPSRIAGPGNPPVHVAVEQRLSFSKSNPWG